VQALQSLHHCLQHAANLFIRCVSALTLTRAFVRMVSFNGNPAFSICSGEVHKSGGLSDAHESCLPALWVSAEFLKDLEIATA